MRAIIENPTEVGQPAETRAAIWRALALLEPNQIAVLHMFSRQDERMCLGELAALGALRLATRAAPTLRATASVLWPDGQADVAADTPVCQYTVTQFVRALQALRDAMTRRCYSEALVSYCQELERRGGLLLFYTWPESVCDCAPLRQPVTGGAAAPQQQHQYAPSDQLRQLVWCSFTGIYRRLLQGGAYMEMRYIGAVTAEEMAALRGLHDWFTRRAAGMISDESSVVLRRLYPQTQLRPGDAEIVRFTRRGMMPNAAGVLQYASEPGRMAAIMSQAEVPLALALRHGLPTLKLGAPEPVEVGLCMAELLDVLTRECGRAAFGLSFCISEPDLRTDPDSVREHAYSYPVVAQVFNHWQILYRDVMFVYNSFLRALYAWLHTMCELAAQPDCDALVRMAISDTTGQTAYDELQSIIRPTTGGAGQVSVQSDGRVVL
jgi:hypothetical protein